MIITVHMCEMTPHASLVIMLLFLKNMKQVLKGADSPCPPGMSSETPVGS